MDSNNDLASQSGPPGLVLILGGARSGKSTFAEHLAINSGRRVAFIATATASDEDMRDRISHHQASRPASWLTIEEPLQLANAVREASTVADVLILDCVTVWLSNWLFAQDTGEQLDDQILSSHRNDDVLQMIDDLLQVVVSWETGKTLIVVTNEVGLGIVPAYALGRVYRDLLGLVNQHIAAAASRVYLMVAGLGVDIKRLHEQAVL